MNPVSLMANAEKLSIAQLQQAVKNGTIPAYIGIPMMQEKMKQAKQAQPAQAPTEPPIAQQVMAEASGIDQMPSNLPTQSMNDGGIVSFADGGDAEDFDQEEYEDQRDEAEYAQAIEDSLNAAEQEGGRLASPANTRSAGASVNTPFAGVSENINKTPNVEGGIRSVVNDAANRYGLPPELLQRISGSESGHNPRAKNSASSAEGLFQFIPSTWAGMGGKPGEQSDPVKNADLGGKFIRQNAETLKRQLGRNPNYDEVYAAHYFGPGVTAMLKNATPDMPIEQGLRMFNSEKFVPVIMQQNPNLRNKTVGQVMGSLREKMGDGQVSLAEGGIARLNKGGVPRFQSAGFVSDEDADAAEFDKYMRGSYRNPYDNSIEGIKERMQVMDDRQRARLNNYSGLPSPFGTLSGAERDKYIAGLTQPKQDTSSPAGRFVSGLFNETPQQKQLRLERQNALSDRNRVMQNVKSNPFATQTKEEYENSQRAIEQANLNVAQANRGGGYAPPDLYSYSPSAAAASPITPATTEAVSQRPTLVADDLYGGTAPSKDFSFIEPKTSSASGVERLDGDTTSSGSSSGTKQKSEYDLIREDIMNQRAELKRQKQEDKYMAIIQAGLGMMAGTSPNAFANIGQGASAGIAQYGASGKQRAAENAALNKGLITAQRYKGMDDYQRAALVSREGYQKNMIERADDDRTSRETLAGEARDVRKKEFDQKAEENIDKNIANRQKAIESMVTAKLSKLDPLGSLSGDQQLQKFNQMVQEELARDMKEGDLKNFYERKKYYQKQNWGIDFQIPNYGTASTSAPSGVTVRKVK